MAAYVRDWRIDAFPVRPRTRGNGFFDEAFSRRGRGQTGFFTWVFPGVRERTYEGPTYADWKLKISRDNATTGQLLTKYFIKNTIQ